MSSYLIVTALNRNKASSEFGHNMLQSTGPVAQSVATADPGVARLIPARSLTFVEIDHETISRATLLLPLIQEGLVKLQAKVCVKFAQETLWLG